MLPVAVVGAGFAGAVIARKLVDNSDLKIIVFESREHIAGNCHTSIEPNTKVMVHNYGPHIFHTANNAVWEYLNQFTTFERYENRVVATTDEGIYALPINLLTINQFFNKNFSPSEAKKFIRKQAEDIGREPRNFEEAALAKIGKNLYYNFFHGYTKKQWGIDPKMIPASVFGRLPVRFNYDNKYFSDPHQGIPKDGYTAIVEKILDHPNIEVRLNTKYNSSEGEKFEHTFYSGPIDGFYSYRFGRLKYRSLKFDWQRLTQDDYQGNAVMNYCSPEVAHTRITEYKHFQPSRSTDGTLISTEYSHATGEHDVPYYPVRATDDMVKLKKYIQLSKLNDNITFAGRLGTYCYLNMDQVVANSLESANNYLMQNCFQKKSVPVFDQTLPQAQLPTKEKIR